MSIDYAIPMPDTLSKKSIIKSNLKEEYYRGRIFFAVSDFEFGLEKHIAVFKKLPWVQYQKITDNHVFIWLNDPKGVYSQSPTPIC